MLRLLLCWFVFTAWLPLMAQVKPGNKIKKQYDYLLHVPKHYSSTSGHYPLLIYLHGGSLRGRDLTKLKAYGPPQLVEQGRDFDFIIASPQCPEGKFWSTDNWFEPLYTELITKYRVDTRRVYLTGISMGGYGTWQTAVAYPDKFAAIVPLCGGCDDSTQICRINQVPVWTFHGTADEAIPISVTERLVKSLTDCQGNVRFTKLTHKGHAIEYLYGKRYLYKWLLKQHR